MVSNDSYFCFSNKLPFNSNDNIFMQTIDIEITLSDVINSNKQFIKVIVLAELKQHHNYQHFQNIMLIDHLFEFAKWKHKSVYKIKGLIKLFYN